MILFILGSTELVFSTRTTRATRSLVSLLTLLLVLMFGTRRRMWSTMKGKRDQKKRKVTLTIPLRRPTKKAKLETKDLYPVSVVSEYKARKVSCVRDWPPYCGSNMTRWCSKLSQVERKTPKKLRMEEIPERPRWRLLGFKNECSSRSDMIFITSRSGGVI
ncbi:uncharacterized protein LOC132311474 [Cornus florida]|uniref:uncharacterized protein LOC132311474 n=1 Tax=Cornus florida TaxID=4283 RepID=UPI0028A1991D|nr:uncharacterized protein LOC132311474 [Cornus florida]XP_059665361.1 uncharacterized protein LOC132311474 [Cornus florida]